MSESTIRLPEDPLHDTEEAAVILNSNPRTMERWRTIGYGPPFVKIGRAVRYRRSSLEEFANQQTRTHTGQAA